MEDPHWRYERQQVIRICISFALFAIMVGAVMLNQPVAEVETTAY